MSVERVDVDSDGGRMGERFELHEPDPGLLAGERDRVMALIRARLPGVDVHEIGSTCVPGVIGKGDIDLLVRVPMHRFAATRDALDALFRRNEMQHSDAMFQGYVVPAPIDVAVQLTVEGGPYDNFDRFLEALRASPDRIRAYNALKRQWAGRDMEGYRRAKASFIEATLAEVRSEEG
jgi:GrpB-like predicted nucleotidyltransferase (UPF0157 family)